MQATSSCWPNSASSIVGAEAMVNLLYTTLVRWQMVSNWSWPPEIKHDPDYLGSPPVLASPTIASRKRGNPEEQNPQNLGCQSGCPLHLRTRLCRASLKCLQCHYKSPSWVELKFHERVIILWLCYLMVGIFLLRLLYIFIFHLVFLFSCLI